MKTTLPPFSLLCAIFALFDACACLVLPFSVACALWSLKKAIRGADGARTMRRYEDPRICAW